MTYVISRHGRYLFILVGIALLLVSTGCSDNNFEKAYQTAKTLSSNGSLSDSETIKYYKQSQELLRELAGIKIKAEQRNLYVLEKLLDKYEDMKMWPKAIETADKLINLQPTEIEWYIRKGRAHVQMSDIDKSHHKPAERAFKTALELDNKSLKAHFGLGLLYGFHMDKKTKALEHLRIAAQEIPVTVKNRPDVVEARFALGKLEFQGGELSRAQQTFKSIISMESITSESRFLAHKNLGDVYRQMGSRDLAKQHYHKAYEMNPTSSEIRSRLRNLGVDIQDRFNRFERQ